MRSSLILFLNLILFSTVILSCKKKERIPEPGFVLGKWSNAIKELKYSDYRKYEAYPKSNEVFREIYKDEYFTDIMVTGIEEVDYDDVKRDFNDNSYISCSVTFEGIAVKRQDDKPYQTIRGDVLFVQFTNGDRSKDGWLISNRSIIRINR